MDIGDLTESYWVCEIYEFCNATGPYYSLKVVVDGHIRSISFGGWGDSAGVEEDPIGPFNLRWCFKLKDELPIKGGNGEKETPYQLIETE